MQETQKYCRKIARCMLQVARCTLHARALHVAPRMFGYVRLCSVMFGYVRLCSGGPFFAPAAAGSSLSAVLFFPPFTPIPTISNFIFFVEMSSYFLMLCILKVTISMIHAMEMSILHKDYYVFLRIHKNHEHVTIYT